MRSDSNNNNNNSSNNSNNNHRKNDNNKDKSNGHDDDADAAAAAAVVVDASPDMARNLRRRKYSAFLLSPNPSSSSASPLPLNADDLFNNQSPDTQSTPIVTNRAAAAAAAATSPPPPLTSMISMDPSSLDLYPSSFHTPPTAAAATPVAITMTPSPYASVSSPSTNALPYYYYYNNNNQNYYSSLYYPVSYGTSRAYTHPSPLSSYGTMLPPPSPSSTWRLYPHPADPLYPAFAPADHPYDYHTSAAAAQNADTRKRARRQAAGNLVSGLFAAMDTSSSSSSIKEKDSIGAAGAAATGSALRKSTAQPRPSIKVPPRGIGPVHEPNLNDVLCGRGGRINAHAGNVQFRDIVADRKKDYLAKETKKLEKAHIAASIVKQIRDMTPAGRFLKEDPDGSWYDIGDAKAIKKVGQALREDAPDIREELKESDDEDGKGGGGSVSQPRTSSPMSQASAASPSPMSSAHVGSSGGGASVGHGRASPNSSPKAASSAAAVSGRGGAKAAAVCPGPPPTLVTSNATTSSSSRTPYQPIAYQHLAPPPTYQPIVPQQQHHHHHLSHPPSHTTGRPHSSSFRGRQVPTYPSHGGGRGFSGAAAAAMNATDADDDLFEIPPTRDIAFGRSFHPADAPHPRRNHQDDDNDRDSSLVSGMSGISALTDPISALSGSHEQVSRQQQHYQQYSQQNPLHSASRQQQHYHQMRASQLQQLRQQWAASQQSSNSRPFACSLPSSDLTMHRSLMNQSLSGGGGGGGGGGSNGNDNTNNTSVARMRGSSYQELSGVDSRDSWAENNSLMGGGIRAGPQQDDNGSIISGFSAMQSVTMNSLASFSYSQPGPAPNSMHYPGDLATPTASMAMRADGSASTGSSDERRRKPPMPYPYARTTRHLSGTTTANMSILSAGLDSLPSVSGSIMSDLSENLVALDLAEPML